MNLKDRILPLWRQFGDRSGDELDRALMKGDTSLSGHVRAYCLGIEAALVQHLRTNLTSALGTHRLHPGQLA